MPHVEIGDIRTYYEIHGASPVTLTLVRGLGADVCSWFDQVPEFARHFRTLVFDNRGAGRTDKPDAPYSIRQMAADLKNLLDALHIGRTALLGMSMGGMIAQEFALTNPEKLSSLILVCTSFGGPNSVAIPKALLDAILAGPVADQAVRRLQERALYSDDTIQSRRELIAANAQARSLFPIPPFALARQAAALLEHDAESRIGQITAPALVLAGREDRLIPPVNSSLIAERISGALLKELPGGHLFTSEQAELFNREVVAFVAKHG